jgi:hypothetical protein
MIKSDQVEPRVGIFWLLGNRLILNSSSLSEAEAYGDCLTHRNSHIDYWTEQQRLGAISHEIEYEEPPRGRVLYHTKERKFYILADRCILDNKGTVSRIARELNLPPEGTAPARRDPHYKCPNCMKTKKQREQEEADWDF